MKGLFKEDESYLQCIDKAHSYNQKLQEAVGYIKLAEAAREQGNQQAEQENARKVNAALGYTYQLERSYNSAADALSNVADQISGPIPSPSMNGTIGRSGIDSVFSCQLISSPSSGGDTFHVDVTYYPP